MGAHRVGYETLHGQEKKSPRPQRRAAPDLAFPARNHNRPAKAIGLRGECYMSIDPYKKVGPPCGFAVQGCQSLSLGAIGPCLIKRFVGGPDCGACTTF